MTLDNSIILLFLFLAIFDLFIFKYNKILFSKIGMVDKPSKKKIHKSSVPLSGGLIVFIGLVISQIYLFISNADFFIFEELDKKIFFVFLGGCLAIYFIGIIDDLFELNPYFRLFIWAVLIYFSVNQNEFLQLSHLQFKDVNFKFFLNIYSLLITTFCLMLFINSMNLFDGINLQTSLFSTYCLIILFFLSNKYFFLIFLLIQLIFFSFLNYHSKSFMGNGGVNLISFFIGIMFILSFNMNLIHADQIFLIMFFPGLDMFRLFIQRILNSKNPFQGDKNHLHHFYLKRYGFKISIIISLINMSLPYVLSFFLKTYICILLFILIYSLQLFFLKNSTRSRI